MHSLLDVHPEVLDAIHEGKPVVALESTIIAHGMPYPQNIETARNVESIVRDNGAIPATIAVFGGKFCIGLAPDKLEQLANSDNVVKLSRRDLGHFLASGRIGATTVASTMIGASMAGIKMFVTGGIGGVHRGADQSFDVSADLYELKQTAVAVVTAGAKAILDIPKTLEMLESFGVPVIGYRTDEFPAFYSRESGCKAPVRIDDENDIARALFTHWQLPNAGGVVIANPISQEFSMDSEKVEAAIDLGIREAASAGIKGKELTPFLLKKIVELTEGRSLEANLALVKGNAAVGAKIAVELASLGKA